MFSIPLKSVATSLSIPLNFLELLGLRSKIALVGTSVVSACLQKLVACGVIGKWDGGATGLGLVDAVLTDSWGTGASGTSKASVGSGSTPPPRKAPRLVPLASPGPA